MAAWVGHQMGEKIAPTIDKLVLRLLAPSSWLRQTDEFDIDSLRKNHNIL